MQHYIDEIRRNHRELDPVVAEHAANCPVCRRELELLDRIGEAVAALPRVSAPAQLKQMVMERLYRPAYRAWHLAVAGVLAGLAPLVFHKFGVTAYAGEGWAPAMFVAFGILNFLLVFAAGFHLLLNNRRSVESLERTVEDYLEHPGRLLERFRH